MLYSHAKIDFFFGRLNIHRFKRLVREHHLPFLAAVCRLEQPDEQDDDQGNDQGTDQSLEAIDLARGLAGGLVDVLDRDGAESVQKEPEDDREDDEPEDVAAGVAATAAASVATGSACRHELNGLLNCNDRGSTSANEVLHSDLGSVHIFRRRKI